MFKENFHVKKNLTLPAEKKIFGPMLCLAGCEDEKIRNEFHKIGVKYILVSYYYLRKVCKKWNIQRFLEDFGRFDFVYLDSGGFTLIQQSLDAQAGKKVSKGNDLSLEEYTEEYYQFIRDTKGIWNVCAEVDLLDYEIDGKKRDVGFPRDVLEYNREKLLADGVPISPVFQGYEHEYLSALNEWGWFEKYPYISVGSGAGVRKTIGRNAIEYRRAREREDLIRACKKNNIVLHGLGMTDAKTLARGTFFSVDSSVGYESFITVKDPEDKIENIQIGDFFKKFGDKHADIFIKGYKTLTVDENNKIVWGDLYAVSRHDVRKKIYTFHIEGGITLRVTSDHSLIRMNSKGELFEEKPENFKIGDLLIKNSLSEIILEKIVKIEVSEQDLDVYDLSVDKYEKFFANSILVHNTTWNAGARFGNTHIFQNGRIRVYTKDKKDVRKRYRNKAEEAGLNWENIMKEKTWDINMFNALAWVELQNFVNYNVKNSYWLSEEEKREAIRRKQSKFQGICDLKSIGELEEEMSEELDQDLNNEEEKTEEKVELDFIASEKELPKRELDVITRKGDLAQDERVRESLFCDTCYIAGKCPKFMEGQRCGYAFSVEMDSPSKMLTALQTLLTLQSDRVIRASHFEKVESGVIDKNLSGEIKMLMDMFSLVHSMASNKEEIKITAKGSGIIAKLFGKE